MPIDGGDDVFRAQPGLRGRRARLDLRNVGAHGQAIIGGRLRIEQAGLDAQVAGRLVEQNAADDEARRIARDGEAEPLRLVAA